MAIMNKDRERLLKPCFQVTFAAAYFQQVLKVIGFNN